MTENLRAPVPQNPDARLAQRLTNLEQQITQLESRWNSQYTGRMYRIGAQTLATGWNKIELDSIQMGNPVMCNTALHCYVVQETGNYFVSGCVGVSWTSSSLQNFLTSVWLDGNEYTRGERTVVGAAAIYNVVVSGIIPCTVGQKLELYAYTSLGGSGLELSPVENTFMVARAP